MSRIMIKDIPESEKISEEDARLLRIQIRPNRVPKWVEEWNTDPIVIKDDTYSKEDEKNGNTAEAQETLLKTRTVLLKRFVENIISSYQTPLTLARVYLFID